MGSVIRGVGSRLPDGPASSASAIDLAGCAARELLDRCGVPAPAIDLVVNAGIYRDESICEPALAPLIQRAHLERRPPGDLGVFSFDVGNGGCGLVSAFQVVDSFLRAGTRRLGLVVASDVDPTPGVSRGFRFDPCGAAILLERGPSDLGFAAFHTETFTKYADLFVSRGEWIEPRMAAGIVIRESEEYAARCAECAAAALRRFLGGQGLAAEDLDLIVPSSAPAGFAARLMDTANLPEARMATTRVHALTAGPMIAYESAMADERLCGARNLLFATVGAGITVSLALYRNAPATRRRRG